MSIANPWDVDARDFPAEGAPIDKLRFILNYAVLAPSSHNTQPWLLRLSDDGVDLFADRTRALPVVDPLDRELVISCGAAIGMARIALRAFGFEGEVELLPDSAEPDLLARIGLGRPHVATKADLERREAILRRRTLRVPFDGRTLPFDTVKAMQKAAEENWAHLRLFTNQRERAGVIAAIGDANRLQFADPSFRRELSSWMHARRGFTRDGMSMSSMGVPDVLTPISALAVRTFDIGEGRAAEVEDIARYSPALGILSTDRDCVEDWLLAGQALAHILVTATAAGLACGYLNQPLEVPGQRVLVARMTAPHAHPQLILRIGYGPQIPPASRRPLDQVLIDRMSLALV
jgi:nitroreductase